jgi:hypothetical protein
MNLLALQLAKEYYLRHFLQAAPPARAQPENFMKPA